MVFLEYFLYLRVAVLWEGRNLPSVCMSLYDFFVEGERLSWVLVSWPHCHADGIPFYVYYAQFGDVVRSRDYAS